MSFDGFWREIDGIGDLGNIWLPQPVTKKNMDTPYFLPLKDALGLQESENDLRSSLYGSTFHDEIGGIGDLENLWPSLPVTKKNINTADFLPLNDALGLQESENDFSSPLDDSAIHILQQQKQLPNFPMASITPPSSPQKKMQRRLPTVLGECPETCAASSRVNTLVDLSKTTVFFASDNDEDDKSQEPLQNSSQHFVDGSLQDLSFDEDLFPLPSLPSEDFPLAYKNIFTLSMFGNSQQHCERQQPSPRKTDMQQMLHTEDQLVKKTRRKQKTTYPRDQVCKVCGTNDPGGGHSKKLWASITFQDQQIVLCRKCFYLRRSYILKRGAGGDFKFFTKNGKERKKRKRE
jgi:hypothetical protein